MLKCKEFEATVFERVIGYFNEQKEFIEEDTEDRYYKSFTCTACGSELEDILD